MLFEVPGTWELDVPGTWELEVLGTWELGIFGAWELRNSLLGVPQKPLFKESRPNTTIIH